MGNACSCSDSADVATAPEPIEKRDKKHHSEKREKKRKSEVTRISESTDVNTVKITKASTDPDVEIILSDAEDSDIDDFNDFICVVNPKRFDGKVPAGFKIATPKSERKQPLEFKTPKDIELVPNPAAPSCEPKLEWGYGCASSLIRSAVVYSTAGCIVYPLASVLISYDVANHEQKHFFGHSDDISCLAQHPLDSNIIATGQVAAVIDGDCCDPIICVTNVHSGEIITLPPSHKRRIICLGFSCDGRYLASVGEDESYYVIVWDWKEKTIVSETRSGTSRVYSLAWSSVDPSFFICVGVNFVKFFDLKKDDEGDMVIDVSRGLCNSFPIQSFVSITFSRKGFPVVGAKDGSLYLFMDRKAKARVEHCIPGPINAVCSFTGGPTEKGGVVAVGKQGTIQVLASNLTVLKTITLPNPSSSIRSAVVNGDNLLVSTSRGEIYELPAIFSEFCEPRIVLRGHCDGEVWGIAPGIEPNTFFTVGDDNLLIKWDAEAHRSISITEVNSDISIKQYRQRYGPASSSRFPSSHCFRAVAVSDSHIAVGSNNGRLLVFSSNMELSNAISVGAASHWIQTLAFSPNGKFLAVGTHGDEIVLFDTNAKFAELARSSSHASGVCHIDWSLDSTAIRSCCEENELLIHSVSEDGKELKHIPDEDDIKDIAWASHTVVHNWDCVLPESDIDDLKCASLSSDKSLIALGDEDFSIRLYNYPVTLESEFKSLRAHSSEITNVLFLQDRLISAGGQDQAIFQWKV